MPTEWHIGAIVGGSGTGKSTIAKELFGDHIITGFEYKAKSVVDDIIEGILSVRYISIYKHDEQYKYHLKL